MVTTATATATATTTLVRSLQHDTVDAVCWRHLGQTHGLVEATLTLNPGLAARGVFLAAGVPITLPSPRASSTAATPGDPLIQLWD